MYAYTYPLFLVTHSLIHKLTQARMHNYVMLEPQGMVAREVGIRKALVVSSTAGYDRECVKKLMYFLQGGGIQILNFTIPSAVSIPEVLTEGSDLLQRTSIIFTHKQRVTHKFHQLQVRVVTV